MKDSIAEIKNTQEEDGINSLEEEEDWIIELEERVINRKSQTEEQEKKKE